MSPVRSTSHLSFRRTGAALWLVVALCIMVVVVGLVLLDIYWLHFISSKQISAADTVALASATALNKEDRAGQINFMVVRARELLFCCREAEARAEQKHSNLAAITAILVDRSKRNAELLKNERNKLMEIQLKEATQLAMDSMTAAGGPRESGMPGVSNSAAKLRTVEIGYLEGNLSNIEASKGNELLLQYDQDQGYIDKTSGLYKGNIDLKLPDEDGTLEFQVSILPAAVHGTISSPRLALPSSFHKVSTLIENGSPVTPHCEYFPSAARVELGLMVQHEKDKPVEMKAIGVAASCGGSPMP